jgi:hypothetical protein
MTCKQIGFSTICLVFSFIFVQILSAENRGLGVKSATLSAHPHFGEYYGLLIGINAYKEWNPLRTAVRDAEALKRVLIDRYGFKKERVIIRTDDAATRYKLINDIRNIASRLGKQDNLLIYYAGHGQIDDLTGEGYWIPVEGQLKMPSTWIAHSTIKNILSAEKVLGKNIVVIADSCYSGILLRGGPSMLALADQGYQDKLFELAARRSRQVITSGGVEPVADGGRDGHSLFAYYFLKALKENKHDIIDLENLFHSRVWKPVTEIGGQRPNVGRLKTPMDEDGQFVLVANIEKPKDAPAIAPKSKPALSSTNSGATTDHEELFWESIKDSEDVRMFEEYLRKYPDGAFNGLAMINIEKLGHQSHLNLAVFPIYVSTRSTTYNNPEKTAISCLSHVLGSQKKFVTTYSYYDLGGNVKIRAIGPDLIGKKVRDQIWVKESFFSLDRKPDFDLVQKLGEQLNVGFVTMSSFIYDNDAHGWDSQIYLIDVAQRRTYTKTSHFNYSSFNTAVKGFIENFFDEYDKYWVR